MMDPAFLITAFTALFVVIDPIGLMPLFVTLTHGADARHRRGIAIRACLVAFAVPLAMARAVSVAIERNLATLERRAIAGASWRDYGAIITVPDLSTAARLSNRVAPEHLELCTADPMALADEITHAGAIFLGAWTPEAIGDYVGGPNHVLPTARSARFSSGLNVLDFLKRTTLARMTPEALRAIGPAAETLAISESLEAHGLSVRARLNHLNEL